MAIIKDLPTQFGISASYHRLDKVEVMSQQQEIVLHVAVYASEEARQTGGQPLSIERVIVPFWRLASDPRSTFYRLLQDYDGSLLFEGEADVDAGQFPSFDIPEYIPPPLPPGPVATEGPESVPGAIPRENATP